jgi:hypothetical protein
MPVIDGEKWACNSCIKGHRVSGCTHIGSYCCLAASISSSAVADHNDTDRELHHINPKGRPVKQCEHCRGARKSKSHHAKCDCGEKKDKDKHKDKGDAKGERLVDNSVDEVSNHAAVHANRCACHSGAKCICGLKKDPIDLKLDTSRLTLHAARAKPKLTSTHSESTLTVFANGHHKPCHRNNNTAHVSGAPYKLNRPHTLHGLAAFAGYTKSNPTAPSSGASQRSMDTLSLANNEFHSIFGTGQRSMDGVSITPLSTSLEPSTIPESLFTGQSTAFNYGPTSPDDAQLGDLFSNPQWPLQNSIATSSQNFGYGSLSTSPSQDCLPNYDNDWAIPSAGFSNPLWSATDLPLDPSKLNDTLAQPISHSGESNKQSNAGLTTASSSHSESEEPVLFGEADFTKPPSVAPESSLFWEDNPVFRFPNGTSNDVGYVPSSLPSYVEGVSNNSTNVASGTIAATETDKTEAFSADAFTNSSAVVMPAGNVELFPTTDEWTLLNQNNILDVNSTTTPTYMGFL